MNWIDRVERKIGHLAIPNLIRIVAGFNVLVFVLCKLNPPFLGWLTLDPAKILNGEVWRLITYVFVPTFGSPVTDWLFVALYILYLWFIGDGLESAMGSFRVNLFYFLGMIGTTAAAMLTGASFGTTMLNYSLLFAFARFYPDTVIYIMMVLPMKVKWIAWFSGALVLLGFLGSGWSYRAAVLVALGNFFLFFGREIFREVVHRQETQSRRRRFEADQLPADAFLHQCTVCNRTEQSAPDLDFRVSKDGNEYCSEHLPKAAPLP
ncbi:MAG TPA: rhomboid family intramembrane serine protease [Chthoniobacteraceae bacterium]|jgi:hypothetical protein